MSGNEGGFLVTQIDHPEEQNSPEKEEKQEAEEEDPSSLRQLLTAFNSYDRQEKGLIRLEEAQQILSTKGLPAQGLSEWHKMSLPLFEDLVSFDELLFVVVLAESSLRSREEQFEAVRRVDSRLIDFLKLLNKYRKKSERGANYKQARNSRNKIEEIRTRQLERRNRYLRMLYQQEVTEAEQQQEQKFLDFCLKWDAFMNDYEATAGDLLRKVRERQTVELSEFEGRSRQELGARMHFSKYLLQLQTRQKNLVKVQDYEKAREVQREIEEMRTRELREKELADLEALELRLRTLRKQQEAAVSTLLQKIQKDRNEHLRKRQAETEKLIVRNKAQLAEIDHRLNENLRKVHDALHNLGLDNDKPPSRH